jgi:hypothetical protein
VTHNRQAVRGCGLQGTAVYICACVCVQCSALAVVVSVVKCKFGRTDKGQRVAGRSHLRWMVHTPARGP